MGATKGTSPEEFLPYFDDITCVEASDVAVEEARSRLGGKRKVRQFTLRGSKPAPGRYDNIVLTHVLEHLDDPVLVLENVSMTNGYNPKAGRFFLVCPKRQCPFKADSGKDGADHPQYRHY